MIYQRENLILDQLNKESTVLDVGCVHNRKVMLTDNWQHNLLLSKSDKVCGIDFDYDSIQTLKKKGFDVHFADAQNFNLNKKFDFIIAGEIIEHLINFEGFFKSLKKHMHDKTIIIITTPNVWCAFNFISIIFRHRTPIHKQHSCWFCETTFEQLITRLGFKISKSYYLATPNGVRFSILSRILIFLKFKKIGASALYFEITAS